jgi:hypothetical protein
MLRSVFFAAIILGGQPALACFTPDPPGYLDAPLRPGVYGCYDSDNNWMMAFGVVDATTYRDDKGAEGGISYDPATGVLTLTTGSFAGSKFQRQKVGHFCVMSPNDGHLTRIGCAFDEKKNVDTPPW